VHPGRGLYARTRQQRTGASTEGQPASTQAVNSKYISRGLQCVMGLGRLLSITLPQCSALLLFCYSAAAGINPVLLVLLLTMLLLAAVVYKDIVGEHHPYLHNPLTRDPKVLAQLSLKSNGSSTTRAQSCTTDRRGLSQVILIMPERVHQMRC
jgi:hypothetical protein